MTEYQPDVAARSLGDAPDVAARPLGGVQGTEESTSDRSVGEVLGDASRNLSTLVRQEIELGKAEVRQSASQAGKGVGMLAGAGVAALLLLVFLSVAAWWGIGNYTGRGWSALIVAAFWLIVAAILAVLGRNELRRVRGVPDTADTVGKIPNALKGQEEKNL